MRLSIPDLGIKSRELKLEVQTCAKASICAVFHRTHQPIIFDMVPPIDLTPFRADIESWVRQEEPQTVIIERLASQHQVRVSRTTLQRHLRSWRVVVKPPATDTPELRERIRELFGHKQYFTDAVMIAMLRSEGWPGLSQRQLQRLRLEMGLAKRTSPRKQNSASDLISSLQASMAAHMENASSDT